MPDFWPDTISEPPNPSIDPSELHKINRSTVFKALKTESCFVRQRERHRHYYHDHLEKERKIVRIFGKGSDFWLRDYYFSCLILFKRACHVLVLQIAFSSSSNSASEASLMPEWLFCMKIGIGSHFMGSCILDERKGWKSLYFSTFFFTSPQCHGHLGQLGSFIERSRTEHFTELKLNHESEQP